MPRRPLNAPYVHTRCDTTKFSTVPGYRQRVFVRRTPMPGGPSCPVRARTFPALEPGYNATTGSPDSRELAASLRCCARDERWTLSERSDRGALSCGPNSLAKRRELVRIRARRLRTDEPLCRESDGSVTPRFRVAVIASNRFPLREPFAGGMEAHVWQLARCLSAAGHEVTLFAATGSDPGLGCTTLTVEDLALSPAAQADPSMSPHAFMTDHHAYLTLMMALTRGNSGFDIIHNHSLHHLPVAMAPMLSTPMLTTVHTPPTPWLESALNVTGGLGTRFAAVSRHTADAWRHCVHDMSVIPNGVDTHRWRLGPGGDSLVWFGRITAEKAPHLAIAAARRAGRPLVLAGPVSDRDYFERRVVPELGEDVRYAGHLNHDELAQLVGHSAAALITPVWDEPYGLVVAEAMACGTPVVAFARGGIPEILTPEGGRLVPPGDVTAMAAAIPVAEKLSRAAVHRYAVANCSAEAMVSAYADLYRDVIVEPLVKKHDRVVRVPVRGWGRQPTAAAALDRATFGRLGVAEEAG